MCFKLMYDYSVIFQLKIYLITLKPLKSNNFICNYSHMKVFINLIQWESFYENLPWKNNSHNIVPPIQMIPFRMAQSFQTPLEFQFKVYLLKDIKHLLHRKSFILNIVLCYVHLSISIPHELKYKIPFMFYFLY